MDAQHQQQLQRILENRNRRKRGESSVPQQDSAADYGQSVPRSTALPMHEASLAAAPSERYEASPAAAEPLTSYPSEYAAKPQPIAQPQHEAAAAAPVEVAPSAVPQDRSSSVAGSAVGGAGPARTFMTVNFNQAPQPRVPQESAAPNTSIYGTLTMHRDAFSDFRSHPVPPMAAEHVNPYLSQTQRAAQFAQPVAQQNIMRTAVVEPRVTQGNPFRTQTYEKFVEAPNYAVPHEMSVLNPDPHMGERAQQEVGDLVEFDEAAQAGTEVFDVRQSIDELKQGDWFMKWTRKKDKVHRRYFWLDTERGSLYWGKSAGASIYLSSSIRIEEIAEIQTSCVVDDASGKTLYILVIVCVSRALQIGTELRDKFDKWHDALERLSVSQRQYNTRFYGRYTTAPPKKNQLEKHLQQQQFAANPMD